MNFDNDGRRGRARSPNGLCHAESGLVAELGCILTQSPEEGHFVNYKGGMMGVRW